MRRSLDLLLAALAVASAAALPAWLGSGPARARGPAPAPLPRSAPGVSGMPGVPSVPGEVGERGSSSEALLAPGARAAAPASGALAEPGPPGSGPSPSGRAGLEALRAEGAGEGDFLAAYRELARRDPEGLAALAPGVLAGGGAAREKIALLRAALEADPAGSHELLRGALLPAGSGGASDGGDEDARQRELVVDFTLRLLDRRSHEPAARRLLEEAVWPASGALGEAQRRRAAARLAAAIGPDELPRLSALLLGERDPLVVASAVAALARNPRTGAPPELVRSLGLDPGELGADPDDPGAPGDPSSPDPFAAPFAAAPLDVEPGVEDPIRSGHP